MSAEPSRLYAEIASSPWPAALLLDLTETCDLRCRMCHYWGERGLFTTEEPGRPRARPATLERDLAQRVIAELAPGRPNYALFGGEPLLYPHLAEVIGWIKRAGSVVSLVTNGQRLAELAPMLVEQGLDALRVSLDGPARANDAQRGAGSFAAAMAGIQAIQRERARRGVARPGLGIALTVTEGNHRQLRRLLQRDLDAGALEHIAINVYTHLTRASGEAYQAMLEAEWQLPGRGQWRASVREPGFFDGLDCEVLAREIEGVRALAAASGRCVVETLPRSTSAANLRAYLDGDSTAMRDRYDFCVAPWQTLQITARGEVLPCMGATDLVFGDLHATGLAEIWHGARYEQLRARLFERGLMPHCASCCMLPRLGHWRRPHRRLA